MDSISNRSSFGYETVPIVAPSDGSHIDPSETIRIATLFCDIVTPGYINIESQLSDNQALRINASDQNNIIARLYFRRIENVTLHFVCHRYNALPNNKSPEFYR